MRNLRVCDAEKKTTTARLEMATRVKTHDLFGKVYAALVDLPHRKYISPLIIQNAIEFATKTEE